MLRRGICLLPALYLVAGLGYNEPMKKRVVSFVTIALVVIGWCFSASAQQDAVEPIYRFDPALALEGPVSPSISAEPRVVVEKNDQQTRISLQNETPIAPYVGAERGTELSPEELRLLPEAKERGGLTDYKLEAGVGLHVEDKASLNLGYRFHNHPSLMDERRNDPLSLSGDLRISFDVKVPF